MCYYLYQNPHTKIQFSKFFFKNIIRSRQVETTLRNLNTLPFQLEKGCCLILWLPLYLSASHAGSVGCRCNNISTIAALAMIQEIVESRWWLQQYPHFDLIKKHCQKGVAAIISYQHDFILFCLSNLCHIERTSQILSSDNLYQCCGAALFLRSQSHQL